MRDSLGAAIGLSTRGGEQLLILVIATQLGVFGEFVPQVLIPVTILAMIFTIFISPALLKLFFKKYGEEVRA
jgi:Kef-type K+ transport system membrane component KefB